MRIGIIGGGQLGMMIAEAAKMQGHTTIALDPNPNCSCSYVCDEIIVGDFNDLNNLKLLGEISDVLTYEFENIYAENLDYIFKNYNLPSGIMPLYISQNRIREKENAKLCGLTPVPFYKITNYNELKEYTIKLGLPVIYKTTTLGYDGHGQYLIKDLNDLANVKLGSEGILEKYLEFDYECSIIMVRSHNEIESLPISINRHKHGILDLSIVDKELPIFNKIKEASYNFMIKSNFYGILTIEYFVKGNEFYFNEMAPRPHNSGHYSIEGTTYSQYEMLVDFLTNKPLKKSILKSPTIMKNILSEDYDKLPLFKNKENIYIHDYHKLELKKRRKMAHITFTNLTLNKYLEQYNNLFEGENNE